MTRLCSLAKGLTAALAISVPLLCDAGNIPQYQFSRSGDSYAEFSDGTPIPCTWNEGTVTIYPNNYETPNEHNAQGFPIGFDYRFGGRMVDQFAVSSVGELFLGKGSVHYMGDAFTIGMTPITKGISKADISYKTTGEDGNRIFTLQFKNATLRETSTIKGKYSIQIRLYEADGRAEIAFNELETTYEGNGFDTGIHGWDRTDAVQMTAAGINPSLEVTVSPKFASNILERDSYIKWDENDYDNFYKFTYTFTPSADTTAPANAPTGLTAIQNGNQLNISCSRAEGADATVVLVSESPFTDNNLPTDGETFRAAYNDAQGGQHFPTTIGNAKVLYYGNDSEINLTYSGLVAGTTYYIKAMSANGYPAYGKANSADISYATTQAAPTSLIINPNSANSISFDIAATNNVIVAATPEKLSGYQKGYVGTFGTPSADAKVGDEIEGGGKVVYVGQPGTATIDCDANQMMYLRAWTVKDGVLSATSIDAAGVPVASLPYEPGIENYPVGETLQGWTATEYQFVPLPRAYQGDAAIVAKTGVDDNGQQIEVSLTSPDLPLNTSVKLTFDFAMETTRDAAETEEGGVAIPQGSDPGKFGDTGYLRIYGGNTLYKTVNTYSGTMTSAGSGTNEDGSSTYETVEVDIAEVGNDGKISFRFAVPSFSTLYIKNIRIEQTGEAPKAPETAPSDLTADEDRSGFIYFTANKGADAEYTLVLFSDKPMTASEMPEDGRVLTVGLKLGNAVVLYYGNDEEIKCSTNLNLANVDPIFTDFDTDYYLRAISASGNPLYNRENVSDIAYHTLSDMEYPKNLDAATEENKITVTADKAPGAAGTIILLSETNGFDGTLEDGETYKVGDRVGHAIVIYVGDDSHINATTEAEYGKTYVVTGYSYNSRNWYSDVSRSATVSTIMSGIESVAIEEIDIANAEIYNVMGIKLNVKSLEELPQGIYIINGKKLMIK